MTGTDSVARGTKVHTEGKKKKIKKIDDLLGEVK